VTKTRLRRGEIGREKTAAGLAAYGLDTTLGPESEIEELLCDSSAELAGDTPTPSEG